jgi:TrmH family RNA methyltransferase
VIIKEITSKDNQYVLEALKLKHPKYRFQEKLFLIEGEHLLEMALNTKKVKHLFVLKPFKNINLLQLVIPLVIMKKLSSKKSPPNVIAVCYELEAKEITTKKLIYLDEVSDPGNLGTILRTALAFGYQDILLSKKCASIYNEKVISATQGALFNLNLIQSSTKHLETLKDEGYQIVATSLKNAISFEEVNLLEKYIIVFGNEGRGVSQDILKISDIKIKIPMHSIESLNVSVAASIILYRLSQR